MVEDIDERLVEDYILERDEYTCQKCGAQGGQKGPHKLHVYKTHEYDKLRYPYITICDTCYQKYEVPSPNIQEELEIRDKRLFPQDKRRKQSQRQQKDFSSRDAFVLLALVLIMILFILFL